MLSLSITSELGRFEEFFSEAVYPIWPVWLVAAIAAAAAGGYIAYRLGLHQWALRHRMVTGVSLAVLLIVSAPIAYYTVSPIFDRNTVCEASPIPGAGAGSGDCDGSAVAATMPPADAPQLTSAPSTGSPIEETAGPTAEPFVAHVERQGQWVGADDFHFASGDALLIESAPGVYTLRVENFSVRNGPDVFVLLSPGDGYEDGALDLGALKGTDGAFNYEIPSGTDVSQYKSAIIWCRQFDVLFGHAPLE